MKLLLAKLEVLQEEEAVGPSSVVHHVTLDPALRERKLLPVQFECLTEPHPVRPQVIVLVVIFENLFKEFHFARRISPKLY